MGKEETELQSLILKLLAVLGVMSIRHNVYKPMMRKKFATPKKQQGVGDIIGCYFGNYFEMEVKTPTGKREASQIEREELVKKNGGFYFVVRSLDDVHDCLQYMRINGNWSKNDTRN